MGIFPASASVFAPVFLVDIVIGPSATWQANCSALAVERCAFCVPGFRRWEPQHIMGKSPAVVECRLVELEGLSAWFPQSPDPTRMRFLMYELLKEHIHMVSARTIRDLVTRPQLA
jgi:hypothetical protein